MRQRQKLNRKQRQELKGRQKRRKGERTQQNYRKRRQQTSESDEAKIKQAQDEKAPKNKKGIHSHYYHSKIMIYLFRITKITSKPQLKIEEQSNQA
jgi:hypothetical protein